jgi:hypothetical protein
MDTSSAGAGAATAAAAIDALAWATLAPELFARPFRMQPGLQRVEPGAALLTPLDPAGPIWQEKLAALEAADSDALLGGSDAVLQHRAWCAAAASLVGAFPDRFGTEAGEPASLRDRLLGWQVRWPCATSPAQIKWATRPAAAGRIDALLARSAAGLRAWLPLMLSVHDDLALLAAPDGRLELLAVALPSHWAPRDKIGRGFAAVHAPVADNALLLRAAAALVELVSDARSQARWQRYVWALTPLARYDAHPARAPQRVWPPAPWGDDEAARVFLRFERQAFLPLEEGAALFAIRVHLLPLAQVLERPSLACALHASLASMSAAALAYKGMAEARTALLDLIGRRADALSASSTAAAG